MTELEQRLQYKFSNHLLLVRALTHKSFANEMKQKIEHNEKLEFLGDAVLGLIVAELLYHKYPENTEGGLSKKRASVVNEEVLCQIGLKFRLNHLLQLGKGEAQTGGASKARLIASSFEALMGAIYLDGGYDVAKNIVYREFESVTDAFCGAEDFERDYKTRLQEWVQKSFKETPRYEVVAEEGPSHDRHFVVCVKVKETVWAKGSGRSKKSAEQDAAKQALSQQYKEIHEHGL